MDGLPFRKKLYFGMGGLSMNLCDLVFMQWLFFRYAPDKGSILVAPTLLGTLILFSRVFEAVVGPVIGHWSDGFVSKSGRRLPFVRRGIIPLAAVFFLLYFPPIACKHWLNALYVWMMVPAYLFFYNIVVTPYLGLLPEITSDVNERVNLTTMQSVFITVSAFIFGAMGYLLAQLGWAATVMLVSIVTVAAMMPVCFGIKERYAAKHEPEKLHLLHALLLTLRNRPFVHVVLSTSCFWFGLNAILLLIPYWITHYLGLSPDMVTMLMAPFLVMNLLFFFVFNYLSKRFGKYAMFIVTLAATGFAFLILLLVGVLPGSMLVQSMVAVAMMGMAVAGFSVIPFALLADAVDYDAHITGRRREALFFGFQGTFQKLALGLSTFQFGLLLNLGGAQVSVLGLKLVALSAGLACFIGILLFVGYPLREQAGLVSWRGEPLAAVETEAV